MKKFAIITIIAIALLACKEEQATQYSLSYLQKLEIQNDSDWVEITDIDTVEGLCISGEHVIGGVVCQKEEDYKAVYDKYQAAIKDVKDGMSPEKLETMPPCFKNDYQTPQIDFDKNTLLLFSMPTDNRQRERKLYQNIETGEYLYLLIIEKNPDIVEEILLWNKEVVLLPKTESEKIHFDTLYVEWD